MAKGFKEAGFAERRDTAAKAKQESLKKFEQRRLADDPAELEKRAARMATAEALGQRLVQAAVNGGARQPDPLD